MSEQSNRSSRRALTASARYERLLYTAEGAAAVLFALLLVPGDAGWVQQTPQLTPWYGYGLLVITLVLPMVLGVTAWFVPGRVQRVFATVTVLAFLAAMMLFPLGLPTATLENEAAPWYQGVHALHGLIAATAWRHRGIWAYAIAHGVVIGVVQDWVKTDATKASALSGVNSFVFIMILMAVAQSIVSAAYRLDDAAAQARALAARAAAIRTLDREEKRIDAMVHDDIISVLLAASRDTPPATLASQAEAALAAIGSLGTADAPPRDYESTEVQAAIRDVVERYAPGTPVVVTGSDDIRMPADAVTALADALGEALRNSVRHAGREGEQVPRVVSVALGADAVTVVARDEGRGFARRKTSSRRLGVRLSILERMALVDGGSATVASKPGAGTTVSLEWRRAA